MVRITYFDREGSERTVDVQPGMSLMQGAKQHAVDGIDADCGGACICATCHVYVDPEWQERVGGRTPIEDATIEFAEDVEPNSRLACQVKVTEELDGLVVRIPASQR